MNRWVRHERPGRAECTITVYFASGASTAGGLGDKRAKAKADGLVTWRWFVGTNSNPQPLDIQVECSLGDRNGSLQTVVTVK